MSQADSEQPPITGPPYPPQTAGIGGEPTVIPDVPICAVFIALYLIFFVSNIGLFNNNRRKGHFFVPSALMGGFSMARVLTCSLRIGWATHHSNISLAIAAQIFVNAGVLILYILNILFAQRILRAKRPNLGWNRTVKKAFISVYCLIGVALVLVISFTVISFYTLDPSLLNASKWVVRSAVLWLLIVTILPLILLALAYGLPHSSNEETFGHGDVKSKTIILSIGTCLCITIAGFKTGVLWSPSRPITDPAWYDGKAAFYCFNFMIEIMVLTLYTGFRVDKRMHVPNGSSKRRTYREEARESDGRDDAASDMEEKKRDSGLGEGAA